MIVLDTHIWVWWVLDDARLSQSQEEIIAANEADTIGVSAISCWEIAKAIEKKRLELPLTLQIWFDRALSYPGIRMLELTPRISIESTQLPEGFHRDPADQIIVATARVNDCPLVTSDQKILDYPHVKTIA